VAGEGGAGPTGIETADSVLLALASSAAPGVRVSLGPPPSDSIEAAGVSIYLLSFVARRATHAANGTMTEYGLRYVVTASAPDPGVAHRLLVALLLDATERPDMEVDVEPPPLDLWAGFGVAPQPCFSIEVPLRHQRVRVPAPLVRQPLVVRTTGVRSVRGVLLANDDQPVAGAEVALAGARHAVATDHRGHFQLEGAVAADGPPTLQVTARGRQLLAVAEPTEAGEVIVRIDLLNEDT
jgi:hypothetical protein